MYRNNNLHQKLAVNEILNNVSLSLSLSLSLLGNQQLHRVNFFFFFFWLDALCVPMGEGRKTFYTKQEFIFIFLSYTLLHFLIEVKTIFLTQLFKRLPLSAASNNWFNRQRCHIVEFYLEFNLLMILSPIECKKHKFHSISNARSLTHIVNLSISSSSSSLHFSYYGRNYGFDQVMNNPFKSYLFIILSCSLKQFINFFSFFFFVIILCTPTIICTKNQPSVKF